MTRTVTHEGTITVTFTTEGCMDDYGVPNSPTWWTPTDISVDELYILDEEQDFKKLSPKVQDAILSLADDFSDSDWEHC